MNDAAMACRTVAAMWERGIDDPVHLWPLNELAAEALRRVFGPYIMRRDINLTTDEGLVALCLAAAVLDAK